MHSLLQKFHDFNRYPDIFARPAMNKIISSFFKISLVCCFFVLVIIEAKQKAEYATDHVTAENLLGSTSGELEAGNFSYYELKDQGSFKITLMSLEGDADLYVSSKYRFVDYSNYEFQSATYGVDEVVIDKNMKRPIFISVYAHPYYFRTVYKLSQYSIEDKHDHFNQAEYSNKNGEHEMTYEQFVQAMNSGGESERKNDFMEDVFDFFNDIQNDHEPAQSVPDKKEEVKKESLAWSIFLYFIQILGFIIEALL